MARQLTAEDVARRPLPGATTPNHVAFSPDGTLVTFLVAQPGSLRQDLVVVDVASGGRFVVPPPGQEVDESTLTLEEKLRRERGRELAVGVTRFSWARDAPVLLVPMADGLWVLRDVGPSAPGATRAVEAGAGTSPPLDPQLSPDGKSVAFVRDGELHVTTTGALSSPRRLTDAVKRGATAGLAEFIAQEEMGRSHGFWWSRDSTRLAFCEVDERHIPTYRIVHQGSEYVGEGAYEDHRYPFAGAANARVELKIIDVDSGEVTAADLPPHEYLARVSWFPDGSLVAQVEDREQSRLDVVRIDVSTGTATPLLSERSDVWINLHDDLRPIGTDGSFLWASESTGFRHLEVRAPDGDRIRPLTSGDWMVTGVAAASDDDVWFMSTEGSPLERHLSVVPTDGSEPPRRLTADRGIHQCIVDHEHGRFVDSWSARDHPPRSVLRDLAGGALLNALHDGADDPRVDDLGLTAPELTTVVAADGATQLHAALFRPRADPSGPHPTIVSCYGGPHAQMVSEAWSLTASLRAQWLAQLGYLVVVVDNRGSAGRGLAFEGTVRHDLGSIEVDDQAAAVAQLAERGLVDPTRVGIYGWSYGGYLSLRCLSRRPDVFQAACAGAPVTHWDGYDTFYTERYMGLPAANPDGYERSAVMTDVKGLHGRALLVIHGLLDENVHFRHTARLQQALIEARIPMDLLLFPTERHLPRSQSDRVFMEERIRDFFCMNVPK